MELSQTDPSASAGKLSMFCRGDKAHRALVVSWNRPSKSLVPRVGSTRYCLTMSPEAVAPTAPEPLFSLPVVGETTLEDMVFYAAVGSAAMFGWVQWPTAGLIGSVHALHQRARNVTRTGAVGEVREGLIEAIDDVL